ncbi:sugar ABC transporter permease [Umezawaea sp. Da 62-37]|uniref:carbohydrate ABC transporter permease n=1 Tax=Umezawaea sp. Da 62-37 TaxID=3075927 RepID=UPI0028F6F7BE|nr:sugar ABC transporter permease [Umezawaea sp. Da 62-37]WNV87549.1 sugar ABC transporter permease [Umezawaea sp. Da 62-37]
MSLPAGAVAMVDEAEAAPVAVADRPTAPGRPRRKRKGRLDRHTGLWAAFFLAPTTIGLGVFYLWPVVQTIYFSFTSWGPFGGHTFIGLDNYEAIFQDPQVGVAARNTLYFAVLGLLGLPVSLVLAATLNRPGRKGVSAYRALIFLPVVTMPAAVAIVWRWLFNGDFGIINSLLGSVGISGTSWLSNPDTALLALAVVGIWSTVGYNMVILMAGLQSIPKQFYEAASLDGAGPVRQFTSITVPLLSPSLFFVSVLSVIGSLQTFDLVYVMIGKTSPALPQTRTIVYLFFEKAFIANDRGYAAALAFVLLLVISAITGLQFWLQKKWVHYA